MPRKLIAALFVMLVAGSASAEETQDQIKAEIRKIEASGSCVNFSNLGTNNPKLLNNCNEKRTVQVTNYDRNANKVAERVFHLDGRETRPIEFPGYTMGIDWEKGWSSDGAEDGARFINLNNRDLSGSDLWEARNTSSDRFNAVNFVVYQNGLRYATSSIILPPGQSGRVFVFTPPNTGVLTIDWSRLDPR